MCKHEKKIIVCTYCMMEHVTDVFSERITDTMLSKQTFVVCLRLLKSSPFEL